MQSITPLPAPFWRPFRNLPSESEAITASACCDFSLATLEVACAHPGSAAFALTEQKHLDVWRWAVCGTDGLILHTGCEPSQTAAKRVAERELRLNEA
jgi:hypothetical protein